MAGLLTAALTLAAHSVGGGAPPVGAGAIQLLIVAAVVGGLAAFTSQACAAGVMAALLAAGQLVGHGVLTVHSDHHSATVAAPTWAMVAAHVGATLLGASLISAGDHLCRALSRVLGGAAPHGAYPAIASTSVAGPSADQPMRAALLLASSMSHRGPPACACC